MSNETTFRCGGRAAWFSAPENFAEFENLLKLHKGKLFVLGAGSKTLCPDSGFDGLVISTKNLKNITFENDLVVCDAGAKFCDLEKFCISHGLSGLEWSAAIPASVGGAAVMNAGAFGHDFFESVEKVEIFENGARKILQKNQIEYGYRKTSLRGKVVLRVWLALEKKSPKFVANEFDKFRQKKLSAQPVFYGSAGSKTLCPDSGFDGLVISTKNLKNIT
ncbi:MAG: FAD-binding protein, partial [Clostridia bacterium]|nr:FAD-binding protein [Clostridia bacterium]